MKNEPEEFKPIDLKIKDKEMRNEPIEIETGDCFIFAGVMFEVLSYIGNDKYLCCRKGRGEIIFVGEVLKARATFKDNKYIITRVKENNKS